MRLSSSASSQRSSDRYLFEQFTPAYLKTDLILTFEFETSKFLLVQIILVAICMLDLLSTGEMRLAHQWHMVFCYMWGCYLMQLVLCCHGNTTLNV